MRPTGRRPSAAAKSAPAPARAAGDDWYDTPLYYDIIFSSDTERECDFMEAMLRRHGVARPRRVLEPACGSGRLVAALARRGYAVTGFDRSAPMLAYARQRLRAAGLRARVGPGEMAAFAYPRRFELAHCLVSTFKYLLTGADARAHLQGVADALVPGGLYVLGFHLSDYDDPGCSRERWYGQRDGVHVTCNIQGWPPCRRTRLERLRSRLLVREGGGVRRSETHWQFRSYDAAQARALLRQVPSLELVQTFDFTYDVARPRALDDSQMDCVFVLRKRADPEA